jgi:hypothetical protein
MRKKLEPVPRFESEAKERAFWLKQDSAHYLDWSKAVRARFPNLKPSIKIWLDEKLKSG